MTFISYTVSESTDNIEIMEEKVTLLVATTQGVGKQPPIRP